MSKDKLEPLEPVTLLRLPHGMAEKLRRKARQEGRPIAVLLRLLIDEYLQSNRLVGRSELPRGMGYEDD